MQTIQDIFRLPGIEIKIQYDVELMWPKQGNSSFGKACDVVLM